MWSSCTTIDGLVPPPPPDGAPDLPDAVVTPDADTGYPVITDPVRYLPQDRFFLGKGDIALAGATPSVIDTDAMTIAGVAYPLASMGEVVFDWKYVPPGDLYYTPMLAILHVSSFSIAEGHVARARGDRVLIILADTITIDGQLDAAGRGPENGPGGRKPGTGYVLQANFTRGQPGLRLVGDGTAHDNDGGGGGAAHVSAGAAGGSSSSGRGQGGAASTPFPDAPYLPFLIGGSGGGTSSENTSGTAGTYCPAARGGSGGGAVLLYARQSLRIGPSGSINASGGGGGGGVATGCGFGGDPTGGGGGGGGGVVILQSPMIEIAGAIAANGGGGGSGAGTQIGESGHPGEDGRLSPTPAEGGLAVGVTGGRGGKGAARDFAPHLQAEGAGGVGSSNGGGGGGGIGYLHVLVPEGGTYQAAQAVLSPLPYVDSF